MPCEKKISVPDIFGSQVFNESVMRERLPRDVFKSLRKTIEQGKDLDITVANSVANTMKDWAVEKGATHYSHWFQPMTGITAEKHDSFIAPAAGGKVIMEFSGRELIKGEPDASSLPSGGLRATFEARGYTAWDPTSYAFVKEGTLYIPTAFCSYSGEVLDKKTPLLRSMEALNTQVMRILRLFGDTATSRVFATVGPEQEYFLIDKSVYEKRKDLIYTGRTLFGAKPPKGQELEDHYFGSIKPRIATFMRNLDEELWKLGVLAKTKHNESAPAQHELAPIYETTNIATDHNQLTMEVLQNIAAKHNMTALLHEKPFAGINGSGKHNNWSISTDLGKNLFEPGKNPHENAQFLLFLLAVIKGVDEYQDLLRVSVASAGNDCRLGASEAPPAIISIFLGDELTGILNSLEAGESYNGNAKTNMKIGVHVLPTIPKDTSDRNRTSPFAFTGNKFEFRMLGSALSIACPNIMLNTIVAEELCQFADELEKAKDFHAALEALTRRVIKEHKRIIFNGDGYSEDWEKEAKLRGLSNLKTTADALPKYIEKKNMSIFDKHRVYTNAEMRSRYEIILGTYIKTLSIEATTMIDMAKRDILPAVSDYLGSLAQTIAAKKSVSSKIPCAAETDILTRLSAMQENAYEKLYRLEEIFAAASSLDGDIKKQSKYYSDKVLSAMNGLRIAVDEIESNVQADYWPLPTYGDILYSVV